MPFPRPTLRQLARICLDESVDVETAKRLFEDNLRKEKYREIRVLLETANQHGMRADPATHRLFRVLLLILDTLEGTPK